MPTADDAIVGTTAEDVPAWSIANVPDAVATTGDVVIAAVAEYTGTVNAPDADSVTAGVTTPAEPVDTGFSVNVPIAAEVTKPVNAVADAVDTGATCVPAADKAVDGATIVDVAV